MAKDNRITFRAGDIARTYIDKRQSARDTMGSIINAAMDRLDYLLKMAEPDLTEEEWQLIYSTQSSAPLMPPAQTVSSLLGTVEDSIVLDHMDREHGVDGPALIAKLRELDRLGRMAVVDRAERWWAKNE